MLHDTGLIVLFGAFTVYRFTGQDKSSICDCHCSCQGASPLPIVIFTLLSAVLGFVAGYYLRGHLAFVVPRPAADYALALPGKGRGKHKGVLTLGEDGS